MLTDFGLTKDPFAIVPDGPVENWAGHLELRDDLMDLISGVRSTDIGSSEFLVLHGELGTGKSHALKYIKTAIEKSNSGFNSLAVYVERPRVASKLNFLELYRYIIRAIGRDSIGEICGGVRDAVDAVVQQNAQDAGFGDIANKDTFEAHVFGKLRPQDRRMVKLLKRGGSNHEAVFDFLDGTVKCDGSEYAGKIDSDFVASSVLGDLLRAITIGIGGRPPIFDAAFVFVDECEILFDAKASESDPVFSGFRELVNGVPYGLGLVLSFSAATALIEAYMPQHLLKRLTHDFIEIPMLEDAHAIDFLSDQLNSFRPAGWTHNNKLYPFARNAIEYVVENQTTLTPRILFKDCRRILERAVRRHQLQPGSEINRDLAEQILHYR